MCYVGDIKREASENEYFRKVLFTGPKSQAVLMSLTPGEEIGKEVHEDTDQSFYFVSGKGQVEIGDVASDVEEGSFALIVAGTQHNVKNIGDEDLKFFTIYAPPHHADGKIDEKKPAEAYA